MDHKVVAILVCVVVNVADGILDAVQTHVFMRERKNNHCELAVKPHHGYTYATSSNKVRTL